MWYQVLNIPCLGCSGWRRDERGNEGLHWLPSLQLRGRHLLECLLFPQEQLAKEGGGKWSGKYLQDGQTLSYRISECSY